jgi:omega-6 fatty acid desaturase (delta-12 desaturase)
VPFVALWVAAYLCMPVSYLLSLIFIIPAGAFLVRTFIIFHDCCHKSFFANKRANDIVGTITGILTLSPYFQWRHSHSIHHATNGNLDKRGTGDIWTLTVEEFNQASTWEKWKYRLYRNVLVMFFIGPIYVFLVKYRFNRKNAGAKEKMNTYITNVGIVAFVVGLCLLVGWQTFLLIHVPIFFISGMIGVWLFYIQHTFEDGYFEWDGEWSYAKAAMEGSSFYKLPKVLQWITGSIGYHHIHHLSPRVPNYNLQAVHDLHDELQKVPTISIKMSLQSLRFHLWDDVNKKFVTFKTRRLLQAKK